MGNYISCTISGPVSKQSSGIKIIFPGGEIRHFSQPIKAAEPMLETPGFFLVNAQSLQMGRRFAALNADEDLEVANVYVMFPMKRVNSVVTAADLGVLFVAANSAAKRASLVKRVKILPELEAAAAEQRTQAEQLPRIEAAAVPNLNLEDIDELSAPEFRHRLTLSRSKKPLLETIAE